MSRGMKVMRDVPLMVWFVAALVVAAVHRWVPESTWLMIHLIALGAMTHAVMVWSAHFTAALLRTRGQATSEAATNVRLGLLGFGALLVFIGVPLAIWWLVVVGTTGVGVAVLWHAWNLYRDLRGALPGRFRICIRYYIAAALLLPIGIVFGAVLALGLDDVWHARFLVAHTMTNLLGWFGLTVVGTLVTFWPTLLRTRMDDRSERLARQALPVLLAAIVVVDAGALLGWRLLAVLGLLLYAAGLLWWGRSLWAPLKAKRPQEFAPASVGLAVVWGCACIIATAGLVLVTDDIELADVYPTLGAFWVVGFLLQLVTGALSYLLPSVLGGGPRVLRAAGAQMDRFATSRLVVINGGLLLWLLPLPSWVMVTTSVLVMVALAAFLPLMFACVIVSVREKRRIAAESDGPPPRPAGSVERPSAFTANGLVAGIAALVLAVTVGIGVDPAAVGVSAAQPSVSDNVAPSGEVVRVKVRAVDMRFEPSSIEVAPGDQVIIDLVNDDPTNIHDLVVGDVRSPRLRPGESVELDLGVVGSSVEGWCTVVGHRQMGMTFDVVVDGEAPAPSTDGHASERSAGHEPVVIDPETQLTDYVDPVLPPLSDQTVHRVTLEVTEEPLEVAPGIYQTRWTFNGQSVAPTLRGRVGDVFEVTLVNHGTMGHSVDFHASNLAPDVPMRTIAPGESLVYRFTAERSGIWMYHCSTMPMTAHIAAGMAGAVIIEPEEGFGEVDREYILAQSEIYLDGVAADPEDANPVDADLVLADQPSLVVFNGIANQYLQRPLEAVVGERVRLWVLDIGPNRPSSFHIVGGQFDTVFKEGGYQLYRGEDAFGNTGGGSQALDLAAAQGGFVELVFPEAGNYPVVTHVMVDAERGAKGLVAVADR